MKNENFELEPIETISLRRKKSGFTLMEILLVVALLGGLLVLVVPKFAQVGDNANMDISRTFINTVMKSALFQYRLHTGSYPTTEEGLNALIIAPAGSKNWRGPYIEGAIPLDPWNKDYQYRFPGTKNGTGYDLYSFGVDNVESADDIGNWE